MTATLLHRSGDRATVRLTPSWWERLWGAQIVDVELVYSDEVPIGWYAAGSRRPLSHLPHWSDIREALDFVPVASVPRAVARDFVEPRRHR